MRSNSVSQQGRHCDFRIGGFVPLTTVDYPNHLAAVVFAQGCPWRCVYCHNEHLLPAKSERSVDWGETCAEIEKRKNFIEAVVFSGGEPLAQAGIVGAIDYVKQLGLKVGLHTSGAYPDRLRQVISQIDWVGLDIKALPEKYEAVTDVANSGEKAWSSFVIVREANVSLQVRITTHDFVHTKDELDELISAVNAIGCDDLKVQNVRTEYGLARNLIIGDRDRQYSAINAGITQGELGNS